MISGKKAKAVTPTQRVVRKAAPEHAMKIRAFQIGLTGGLGVLLAMLIGSIVGQLATVILYIGLALFLSLGLDPLVTLIERKLPRAAAIAVVVVSAIVVFAGILLAIVPILVEQTTNLIDDLPGYVKDVTNSGWYNDLAGQYSGEIEKGVNGALEFIQDPKNLAALGGGLIAVGANVASAFTGITIVFILTLYFLASLRAMKNIAARFVPAYRRDGFNEIVDDVSGAVGKYVIGQVGLALINGVLSFILLTIIGAPLPVLLALIAFLGSLIPLVGTLTGSILISLICLFASPLTALVAGIYYLIYLQVEAYVLSPRIMNKAVNVPGAIVVVAAVAGGTIGGVLGALVAIPFAASAIIIIQKVLFPAQDSKTEAPDEQQLVA